ncbi:hypothetical protein A5768_07535 [Mycolicibacterium fortuitum]|nr:hypothetical protein A5768_07535 [Mycolicibacterium fortuitum]
MTIVNKVDVAKFLRERGIPAREAIFAAVILGDKGIDVARVADAFDVAVEAPACFQDVYAALEEAHVRAAAPTVLADLLELNKVVE